MASEENATPVTPEGNIQNDRIILLSRLIDDTNDAFQVSTEDGQFVFMNKEGCERLGMTKEEVLKLHVRDIEKLFTPEGSWEAHVAEVKANGGSLMIESVNVNKTNGREFPVEVSIRNSVINGIGYMIAISKDISLRKENEAVLLQKTEDMERMNKFMTGRELKMAELKEENEILRKQMEKEGITPEV